MANIKITDLNAYSDPKSTDILPIVDVTSDATKKVSIADLMENAGAGADATPGIAFDGDPDTGIYRPGADQIAISTGGIQRLQVDSSGNMLLGGTLPSAPNISLNASGSASFTDKIGINRTPSSVSWLGVDVPDLANNYGIYVRSKVNTSNNLYAYATGNQGSTGATGLWYTQGDLKIGTNLDGASPNVKIALKADGNINALGLAAAGRVYADNTAAKTGGLVDGDFYRKSDGTLMVVFT